MYFVCDKTIINHMPCVNEATFNVIYDFAYSTMYIYSGYCLYFIDNHAIFTRIKFAATDLPNLRKLNFINAGQIFNLKA